MNTARILAAALLVQWIGVLALLLGTTELPWPAAVLLAWLVPSILTAVVLAIETVAGAIADPQGAPARRLLAAGFAEWRFSVRMFGWAMPFASGFAEPLRTRAPGRPAVLLVHGYLCNRAVWRPLLDSGRLADCNVMTVNLRPVFGGIDAYGDVLLDAIERLIDDSGSTSVTIVAHSMGGLATRALLRRAPMVPVGRVITIGTPHAGTIFGRLGPGRNAAQMARGSAWLRELNGHDTSPRRTAARFTCIASLDDNLVVPRASALLPGARHVQLSGTGHLAMLDDPRVWEAVAGLVRSEAGHASGTPRSVDAALPPTGSAAG